MSGLKRRLPHLRRAERRAQPALPAGGSQDMLSYPSSLPAGVDPDSLVGDAPSSSRRARLRRRLRHLLRVRELLLRDLGGLVYEVHRTESEEPDRHRELVQRKVERLAALDAEARALEAGLSEPHRPLVLREPGIGGACPTCGELHGSQARYCSACGMPLAPGAARPVPALAPGEATTAALGAGVQDSLPVTESFTVTDADVVEAPQEQRP